MRAHIVVDGVIVNTVVVERLADVPGSVDADALGGSIGDFCDGEIVTKAPGLPTPVPAEVSRRAARHVLILRGLLSKIQSVIDAIKDPVQKALAQNYWDNSQVFERRHPLLLLLATAAGITETDLDTLFIEAEAV